MSIFYWRQNLVLVLIARDFGEWIEIRCSENFVRAGFEGHVETMGVWGRMKKLDSLLHFYGQLLYSLSRDLLFLFFSNSGELRSAIQFSLCTGY